VESNNDFQSKGFPKDESFFGKRDVSARATHLKAVIGKVSMTTIERKIMSIKTSFKRVALVTIAALGLGMISTIPSQAAVPQLLATPTSSTAATTALVDSTVAASLNVRFLGTAAGDTVTLTLALNTFPGGYTYRANDWVYALSDTSTSTGAASISGGVGKIYSTNVDSSIITTASTLGLGGANTYSNYNFLIFGQDGTNGASLIKAGTYTFTYILNSYSNSPFVNNTVTGSVSITVAAVAADATTASIANSTAFITQGTTCQTGQASDSAVSVLATASDTVRACIYVVLKNAAGTASKVKESVTVTTTAGTVADNSQTNTRGRSVVMKYDAAAALSINVYSDGTAGSASISISTPSATFAAKNVVFYSSTVSKIVATKRANIIAATSNTSAITAVATDANGNVNGSNTAVYIFSDNTAVVSESYTACAFDSTNVRHNCTLTGVSAGTAKITIGNSDKSIVSDVISVTVTTAAPASVSVAFNKASYAPNERGYIQISLKDSAGNLIATNGSLASIFAAGGLSTTANLGSVSGSSTSVVDSLSATAIETKWKTSTSGNVSLDPVAQIPFTAPSTGGTITLSGTGGAGLAVAGRVAVTASAEVTDSGTSALAAVTALASQVSAFITKINAQITTLTDLVMKIQKKVKA